MAGKPTPEFISGLYDAMVKRASDLAPHFTPGYGSKEMTPDDMYEVWNRRAMPLEQEWELHRAVNPDGTPKFTRQQIGLMVFPEREKLAKSGGRIEPKSWMSWVNQQAKHMEQKRAERQAMVSPPPEPMEGGY